MEVYELSTSHRVTIANDASSFTVHEGFLLFTTRSNVLHCVLLDAASRLKKNANKQVIPSISDALDSAEPTLPLVIDLANNHGIVRPIDRGSVLVSAIAGKTDVVLLAPRGNLETIAPRPVVYEVVNKLTRSSAYAQAFELCRKQRVDMNHVINSDYDAFIANVNVFVAQVADPNHLSIFMTFLDGTDDQVNNVCKAITNRLIELQNSCEAQEQSSTAMEECSSSTNVEENETSTSKQSPEASGRIRSICNYVSPILTGFMRQCPRDFKGALKQISSLRTRNNIALCS